MNINILVICITVVVVAAFAAGTVAYVADRKRTRAQAFAEAVGCFLVDMGNAIAESSEDEVSGDE